MKTLAFALLAAFALTPVVESQAETAPTARTQSAHDAHAKTHVKKPVRRVSKRRKKSPHEAKKADAQPPVENPTEKLTEAELAIAPKVYTGDIRCGQGVSVNLAPDDKHPGFFRVAAGKRYYYMHPVVSKTGAVRLEDNRAGAVWLQLANKSILLDREGGGGVVDNCAGPAQSNYAAHMSEHPAPDLLGLGKK